MKFKNQCITSPQVSLYKVKKSFVFDLLYNRYIKIMIARCSKNLRNKIMGEISVSENEKEKVSIKQSSVTENSAME